VGKLIYLTITRPTITYVVGLISQFMHKLREIHWKVVLKILTYIKGFPEKRLLYKKNKHLWIEAFADSSYGQEIHFGYFCVGRNLVTWRSKKQTIMSRSSVETKL